MSLTEVVLGGGGREEIERAELPSHFTAAHLRIEDEQIFRGIVDKDVRRSLHIGEIPMPELAPDEVLIAMMASSINYNTVWSAKFEPLSTFRYLRAFGKEGGWATRHDQPFHVLGSDGSGVVVRVGSGVRRWRPGDHVLATPTYIDDQAPAAQADSVMTDHPLAWGFETNYGALAQFAVARASQILAKPANLTWEDAASIPVCAGTAYRMLVSDRGARMKQGDIVLIWGAAGGLGAFAAQLVKSGGGIAVGVVGSEAKVDAARQWGCDVVINRQKIGLDGSTDDPALTIKAGKLLGSIIRREVGEDPHIVFEHTGRATFGISVFVVRRGGTVVTCGSSTGYHHEYDNRYLWMKIKRIIGSHGANLQEMAECTRLFEYGLIKPTVGEVHPLSDVGEATRRVQLNQHIGKVGVLCLAPQPGLGITAPAGSGRIL
ncbi:crotonyl-CoA carboxylase/reductase [Streptomyces sp. NPDC020965]|uniref:crotonyl-CoA carboxylase/reductase n=1 Tax=Streptomyces sp. NPDC020965 TaxID=3365105 RepID=UPI0037ADF712